jgi:hypothetical protein
MKKIRLILAVALLCGIVWVAQAQTQETFLTVKFTEAGILKTDDFSFEGGMVQILNNSVMVIFSGNSSLNRTYQFDDIENMKFERRGVSVGSIDTENFQVYLNGNMLNISAAQSVGKVNVYSITGAWVAGVDSQTNTAQINISALPAGAYIVQAGANVVKIIKN